MSGYAAQPNALMECPICKLVNPPDAIRCDCGYTFPLAELQTALDGARPRQTSTGLVDMAFDGLMLCLIVYGILLLVGVQGRWKILGKVDAGIITNETSGNDQ
jgi:hypothetical protein